jgi:iron complex transport system ATP-binding protein
MPDLLTVKNLSWGVDEKTILSELNFKIQEGGFVGLIGPNGAGKSSLMRCIYRVNKPEVGRIEFLGQDVWQLSAKENARNMAVILQEQSDHLGLTVRDVVAQGLTPHKKLFEWDTPEDAMRINDVIAKASLLDLENRIFSHLSGGEKQRVMLARAILQRPKLLIMDEPTNHLDVHYQVDVLRQVKALNLTILASFHDLNLASAFCDHILVLDKGKLVTSGTPEEVFNQTLLKEVFNTSATIDSHPMNGHPRITYAYHD